MILCGSELWSYAILCDAHVREDIRPGLCPLFLMFAMTADTDCGTNTVAETDCGTNTVCTTGAAALPPPDSPRRMDSSGLLLSLSLIHISEPTRPRLI
eukprot:3563798-Rhodomonas_salina.1